MSTLFYITDDILIVGFDEWTKDHDETLEKVLEICVQANLKLNKDKCLFRCISIPFLGGIISEQNVSPDPRKVSSSYRHATTKD